MARTTAQRLDKAAASLSAHVRRGATIRNYRSLDLVDRFSDLRERAIQEGVWAAWCDARGWSHETDAYDFFA